MSDRRNPIFDAHVNQLRLQLTHATFGAMSPMRGVHRVPFNRLYFIGAVGEHGGCLRLVPPAEPQTVPLVAGGIYYMPADLPIEIDFRAGLVIAGFHLNVELVAGYDVFAERRRLESVLDRPDLVAAMPTDAAGLGGVDRMAEVRGVLWQALAVFIRETPGEMRRAVLLRDRYAPIVDAVTHYPSAQLTVGDFADAMDLTRDQLSKRFARDIGMPLKRFLSRHLLRLAADRLVTTDRPIGAIAQELDFTSVHYFSRFFRQQTGQSPSDYRRHPPGIR